MFMDNKYVTSPTLPTPDGQIVTTGKEFSDALTLDLNDDEIAVAFRLIYLVRQKYAHRSFDTLEQGVKIVEEMEKEIQTLLAEQLEILSRVDVTPMLMGQPPVLEILGKLPTSATAKYGFDHEKKEYEVKKATERGETYLGEKGDPNATKAKKRDRNSRS
jgi:hypothetical protein